MPHSKPGTMVVTSLTGLMMRMLGTRVGEDDEARCDWRRRHIQIDLRGTASQLEQIQIECASEQYVGGGGGEGVGCFLHKKHRQGSGDFQ